MFIVGVFLGLLVAVCAAPAQLDEVKPIASGNTQVDQKTPASKPEDIGAVSRASYSYTSPDGVIITANLVADENGFQATGDHLRHLPTPPPMPEHRQINVEETNAVLRGSYSYLSPDGVTLTVNWVADDNGFQATGDHLPTPPPKPEHRQIHVEETNAVSRGSYSYTSPDGVVITVD